MIISDNAPPTKKSARFVLNVFPREHFVNAKDRLNTNEAYFTDSPLWRVVLNPKELRSQPECPLPLISNDGESLVLLQLGLATPDDPVVRIYRRDHKSFAGTTSINQSVLVKGISLRQLWPSDKLPGYDILWTDETPQWFAGGSFHFSGNKQELVYSTQWGTTVRIDLAHGSVAAVHVPGV